MDLKDWFAKGMTLQEYIDSMQVNKEEMMSIYEKFRLTDAERSFFEQWRPKAWKVIVLTADWCGDAMLCVPIMMHITEAAAMDMRLLIRDENLELMDQYLTNGKSRSIPIFIFIDQEGTEQAVWGPRAPEVQQLIDEMRSKLPDQDDPRFEEEQKRMYNSFKQKVLTDTDLWRSVSRSVQERFAV